MKFYREVVNHRVILDVDFVEHEERFPTDDNASLTTRQLVSLSENDEERAWHLAALRVY